VRVGREEEKEERRKESCCGCGIRSTPLSYPVTTVNGRPWSLVNLAQRNVVCRMSCSVGRRSKIFLLGIPISSDCDRSGAQYANDVPPKVGSPDYYPRPDSVPTLSLRKTRLPSPASGLYSVISLFGDRALARLRVLDLDAIPQISGSPPTGRLQYTIALPYMTTLGGHPPTEQWLPAIYACFIPYRRE
jgi:hypothetical protein